MKDINWLEEIEKRQEDLLADLFRLLRIDSVRDDEAATEEAPVGPGPLKALEEFLAMAQEDGFETQQFGPWAAHIEVGSGDELLGILGHLDVVPIGTGWKTDPFEPEIIDNKIYARGSSDDKGPTVAAYFALKLLRELGVEFNKRVRLIVGTDEETGWQCMDYYFQHAEMPDFGFSPDGHFPIINGEKGNVSLIFTIQAGPSKEASFHLSSFNAGLRPNMVPQDATAVIEGQDLEGLAKAYEAYIGQEDKLEGSYDLQEDQLLLTCVGKSAHGSTPEQGVNAATYLANFLQTYNFDQEGGQEFIDLLANYLHESHDGSGLGASHTDEVMGSVSMNIGIANYQGDKGGSIDANFRFPKGITPDEIQDRAQDRLLSFRQVLLDQDADAKEPHYLSGDDPMVKTLLEVYERQTGLEGHEKVIGGGTYGRLMPRGVAYGALFPDSTDTMHQANEFISLRDLFQSAAIYAEAIYELTR